MLMRFAFASHHISNFESD